MRPNRAGHRTFYFEILQFSTGGASGVRETSVCLLTKRGSETVTRREVLDWTWKGLQVIISTRKAMPLTEPSTILAFKAGRAFRREGSNIVEPRPDKGAVVIERGEDEELHFMWKNRVTEETEEVRPSRF